MKLDFSAISDVGRVRKDNQDSGYAGPHLLAVCDGVGARRAVTSPRRPRSSSCATWTRTRRAVGRRTHRAGMLLKRICRALHHAHDRIAALVDEDPSLDGTSTMATSPCSTASGRQGHVGDSRAYLFRDGEISQLTSDHTFVQGLIDEGRITEAEARVAPAPQPHPLGRRRHPRPRARPVRPRARRRRPAPALQRRRLRRAGRRPAGRHPLQRLSRLRRGRAGPRQPRGRQPDNVTCLVADVKDDDARWSTTPADGRAAAELRRAAAAATRRQVASLFRGHRAGDTGELEPISAEILDRSRSPSRARGRPGGRALRTEPAEAVPLAEPRAGGVRGRRPGLAGLAVAWSQPGLDS